MTAEPSLSIANPDAPLPDAAIRALAALLIDCTKRELEEQEMKNASSSEVADEA